MGFSRFLWIMVILHHQVFSLSINLKQEEAKTLDPKRMEMDWNIQSLFNDTDLADWRVDFEDRVSGGGADVVQFNVGTCPKPYQGFRVLFGNKLAYTGCYDTLTASTVWTRDIVTFKTTIPRDTSTFYVNPGFLQTTVRPQDLYTFETEKNIFTQTFGASILKRADWFFQKNKNDFSNMLVRGHHSAYADMTTQDLAVSTNRYINVSPQWQLFNNGNWKTQVEANIQQLGQSIPLTVTTGTEGILTINGIPYYLDGVSNIKVPMYFWKLVCAGKGNEIFFIGINFVYDATLISSTTNYNTLRSYVCQNHIFSKTFTVGSTSYSMTMDQAANEFTKGIVFMCERKYVKASLAVYTC